MIVRDLVAGFDVQVIGDDQAEVCAAVPIDQAEEGSISWTRAEPYGDLIQSFGAVVVSVAHATVGGAAAEIWHPRPRWLFGRLVERLYSRRPRFMNIPDDVKVGQGTVIGGEGFAFDQVDGEWFRFPHIGGVKIGSGTTIGSNTCIDRGSLGDTVIGPDCHIDNLVHVAHNVWMGRGVMVVAGTVIGGSAVIDDYAWLGMGCRITEGVRVGYRAFIGAGAIVTKDVDDGAAIVGVNRRIELDPSVRPRLGY